MERKEKLKKYIVRGICLASAVLLVGNIIYQKWVRPKIMYQPQPHTNEELLALFAENRPLFDEVAQIFYNNDRFWYEAKRYKNDPYDTHIWLDSPDERKKMKLFTEEEQQTLRTFFETVGPIMITLDLSGPTEEEMKQHIVLEQPKFLSLRIDFMRTDEEDTYSFIYFYDKPSDRWHKIMDLGNSWFCLSYKIEIDDIIDA